MTCFVTSMSMGFYCSIFLPCCCAGCFNFFYSCYLISVLLSSIVYPAPTQTQSFFPFLPLRFCHQFTPTRCLFFSFWIFSLLISSYDWLSRRPPLSISDLLIKFNRCQAFASMIVIVIFSLALALVLQEFSFSFRSGFALFFLPIPTVHKERIMCLILNRPKSVFYLLLLLLLSVFCKGEDR